MNLKIKARHRQQLLLSLHVKCAHCTPQWVFQQSADAISQNIQPCSNHAQRVCNVIAKNKRGFLQRSSADWQVSVYKWILKLKQDTGTKYYCHCIVNVHIIHHSEFSNRLMMPFPRISKHAVYSWRVLYYDYHKPTEGIFCSSKMLLPFPRIYQWTTSK